MNKNLRMKEILNTLRLRSVVNIKELKQKLNVSEMTIRRDLNELSRDQVVKLIPGGAILQPVNDLGSEEESKYHITHDGNVHIREKINIGRKAASLIEPYDTVILDIGSTTEYVAKFLREDIILTTVCFTLNVLVDIYRKKNCRVIFPGGYLHDETLMFESIEGIRLIQRTRADKAFVSAAGVHHELGVTTVYPYELETKQAIMKSAKTNILVVDSSKFGKTKSVYFADLSDFDLIITDEGIPQEYVKAIHDLGIKLHATCPCAESDIASKEGLL